MGGEVSKTDLLNGTGEVTIAELHKYLANETKFTKEEVVALVEHFRWINLQISGNDDVKGLRNEPDAIIWLLGFWGCTLEDVPVLRDYFNGMDTNVDGCIDVHEYLVALSSMSRGEDREQLELLFHMIDSDRDNVISHDEIKEFVRRMITSEVYWMNYIQSLEAEDGGVGFEFDVSDVRRDAQVEMEFRAIAGAIKEKEITPEIFVDSLFNSGFEVTFIVPVVDQMKNKTLQILRSIPDGAGEVRVDVD